MQQVGVVVAADERAVSRVGPRRHRQQPQHAARRPGEAVEQRQQGQQCADAGQADGEAVQRGPRRDPVAHGRVQQQQPEGPGQERPRRGGIGGQRQPGRAGRRLAAAGQRLLDGGDERAVPPQPRGAEDADDLLGQRGELAGRQQGQAGERDRHRVGAEAEPTHRGGVRGPQRGQREHPEGDQVLEPGGARPQRPRRQCDQAAGRQLAGAAEVAGQGGLGGVGVTVGRHGDAP